MAPYISIVVLTLLFEAFVFVFLRPYFEYINLSLIVTQFWILLYKKKGKK